MRKVKTYPISERKNKVNVDDFAYPGMSTQDWYLDSGVGKNFLELYTSIINSRAEDKPVIVMMGAHVIKCGLSPIIIDLIRKGWITAIAMNGAASIHDFEIAMIGATSESVEDNLPLGKFGMWDETGQMMNAAIKHGSDSNIGMGVALAFIISDNPHCKYRDKSILAACWNEHEILPTVHVAIGTDIIHQHPSANGAAIGKTSFQDFHTFVEQVIQLVSKGGVLLNLGSAVIMPEVFLKALSMAINVTDTIMPFTTANFDMIRQYRAIKNVVERPRLVGATTYNFIGQHELLIPLLANKILSGKLIKE